MMFDLYRKMQNKDKANLSFHNIILVNFDTDPVKEVN